MQLPRIDAHLSPSHFLTFSLSHFLLHHSDTSDGRRSSLVEKRKTVTTNAQRHQERRGHAIFRRGGPLRPPGVIPATNGRPESDGAGRFTTKTPRHQGKNHREDGEVREERAKRFSPQRRRGTEEVIRGKDARQKRRGHEGREWLGWKCSHPCFRSSVVRVVRGHGGCGVRGAAGGAARWPRKRLSFILQFNLQN
jgi:hypothetical protein